MPVWNPASLSEHSTPGQAVTPAIPGPHLLGRKGALADQELDQGFSARLLQVAVVCHGTDHLHHGPFHLQGSKEGGRLPVTQAPLATCCAAVGT